MSADMAAKTSSQKHVMLSGRFNKPEIKAYMRKVKQLLDQHGIKTFMVESPPGDDFGRKTMNGLHNAWAMVVFGTSEYGARTGAAYETYFELKNAYEKEARKELYLVPIQLCEPWPPAPTDTDGGSEGEELNAWALSKAKVCAVDVQMKDADRVAKEIAAALRKEERRLADSGSVGKDGELPPEMPVQMPPTDADMYKMTVIGLKNQKHGEFLYANEMMLDSQRRHVLTWGGGPETPLDPVEKNNMRFNMVDFGDSVGFQSELHKEWMYVGAPKWDCDRRYVLTWKGPGSPKENEMMRFKIVNFGSYVGIKNVRLDQWVYANHPHHCNHRRYVLAYGPEGHPTTNPSFRWELEELSPALLVKIL